ncbi:DUF3768 domain-containing protein [Bacteriovoracales bacterium]|nr:DUF3768 domain-containing protein [Bacteriovoracales bacterium]
MDSSIKLKIREDNDLFRSEMAEELGSVLMSEEVMKSPLKKDIIYHVMDFEFEDETDAEHRYGVFELDNKSIYFKIDYFGQDFVSPKNPYEDNDFKRILSIGILD